METLMKPQMGVNSEKATDDYLQYLRQMNISHCFVMFSNEHSNYEDVNRILDKVRKAGLTQATRSCISIPPFIWAWMTGICGSKSTMT